jgi:hypothetical protein
MHQYCAPSTPHTYSFLALCKAVTNVCLLSKDQSSTAEIQLLDMCGQIIYLLQGHLASEPCKQVAILCVMMDLLVTCDSNALIEVLRTGLVTQSELPKGAGPKRTRKTAGETKSKAKRADEPKLDVRICMLVCILAHCWGHPVLLCACF